MVDLGGQHSIYRVVIYNRKSTHINWRLDTFTLSVGNSLDNLTQCANNTHGVPASGSVQKSCSVVGRYLRFTRNGGRERFYAGLCEVVIVGHLFTDCQQTYCSSTCDDAIGCDACVPGRQRPDCKKPCEGGSHGVNCQEDCGHCKDNSSCDVVNGRCTNSCEDWYITDVCKTFIPTPHFGTSQTPKVDVISSSSAVVSWPKANDIPSGLESYYYYVVWLQIDGGTQRKVAHISQGADVDQLETHISGLVFNTHYSVKVEPYRQYNEKHEGGTATNVSRFKTSCNDPDLSATTSLPDKTSSDSTAAGLGTGSSIILAVGMFLLGLLVATTVLLVVFKMRSVKAKTDEEEQHRERPSTDIVADAVVSDQDYVSVPRVPGKYEDAVEDESGYVHPAAVPGQQNQANVYDVINPTA